MNHFFFRSVKHSCTGSSDQIPRSPHPYSMEYFRASITPLLFAHGILAQVNMRAQISLPVVGSCPSLGQIRLWWSGRSVLPTHLDLVLPSQFMCFAIFINFPVPRRLTMNTVLPQPTPQLLNRKPSPACEIGSHCPSPVLDALLCFLISTYLSYALQVCISS